LCWWAYELYCLWGCMQWTRSCVYTHFSSNLENGDWQSRTSTRSITLVFL